ncbi:hypothetical protein [Brevibacillus porteri]|uniref:hypothetical protein n=1 Tax=Brevibacillus porteri TaxID=2126350 RepID=UPI00362529F2
MSKTKNTKLEVPKKTCLSCGKNKKYEQFYLSNSDYHKVDGKHPVCKDCLKKNLDIEDIETVKYVLIELNRPFLADIWESTLAESSARKKEAFGMYIKNVQLNFKDLTWKDSMFDSTKNEVLTENSVLEQPLQFEDSLNDQKNKEDVMRMLGYDPFETENPLDKRHLYNKLVDFLDESTLEDSFKLPAVIEIVKTFNQLDKINAALSTITSNAKELASNVGAVNSLINAKEKMLKTALALAKDNGISVNHNNNKSKGAGTLSGIIKQLQEKGIHSAEINIYDIETSLGMKQVADISNRSIFEQLMLNENDYTEMIKEQRDMIIKYEQKLSNLEEENRKIKIQLKNLEGLMVERSGSQV